MSVPLPAQVAAYLETGEADFDPHRLDEVLALYADGTLITKPTNDEIRELAYRLWLRDQAKLIEEELWPELNLIKREVTDDMVELMSESRYNARFGDGAWTRATTPANYSREAFLTSARRDLKAALRISE